MDADGYPEDSELETIKTWPYDHPDGWRGLFDYIKARWNFVNWGWQEKQEIDSLGNLVTKLYISTAGWSGNESIISSLESNWMFWSCCWEQSRRGGHYIFELKDIK